MAVIAPPRFASRMSAFMFSAILVGPMAEAGLEGVSPMGPGAELLPEGMGPIVLEA